ncbi:MAG TPA: T9SS type A sorting domain-containing protein, partial [Bacteroidia bacterium]|nr:T9SS type A sorting domain-containing protein [Bacteroidia bacterium]
MKKILLFYTTSIIFVSSYAQITFSKSMGAGSNTADEFRHASFTSDGGYVCTGDGASFSAKKSLVVKLDNAGTIQWSKNFGSTQIDVPDHIHPVSTGGYILAGEAYNSGTGDSNPYMIRMDNAGNITWQKTITGSADMWVHDVAETNGGFVFCGAHSSTGAPSALEGIILKTDTLGTILWTKRIGAFSYLDDLYCIKKTNDNGFVVLGESSSCAAGGLTLFKIDSVGVYQWGRMLCSTTGFFFAGNYGGLQCTSDNGFVYTGFYSSPGDAGPLLVKTDSLGMIEWSRTFTGGGVTNGVTIAPDGGYVIGGSGLFGTSLSKSFLIKTDTLGSIEWANSYGDSTVCNSVVATPDGGYIAVGKRQRVGTSWDAWVAKTDPFGNISGCSTPIFPVVDTPSFSFYTSIGYGFLSPSFVSANLIFTNTSVTPIQKIYCAAVTTGEIEFENNFEKNSAVFPNPTNGEFVIRSEENILSIEVSNLLGQTIYFSKINALDAKIDIINQTTGIYFVKIKTE